MTLSPPDVLLGSRAPRVRHAPQGVASSGADAVELAAQAGLVLDPWQADVLEAGLAEGPDGRWVAQDVGLIVARQNGKGAILEALELAALFLFGERLILHTAHEMKTAKNHYERMQSLIRRAPFLEARVKQWRNSNEEISIELHDGAKLRFIARSTGSGRGFSADRLVLDEAMILSPETMGALLPTLSVAANPQVWYAGSAGLETSAQLARLRERGMKGEDPGLVYFEWSAEDSADLDDPQAWAAANPALGLRLRPESIRSERGSLPEIQFARERLGIWAPTGGDAVISAETWGALADPLSTLSEPVVLALDVSPDRAVASLGAASGSHVEVLENRSGVSWAVERIVNLCRDKDITAVVIDPASGAGALKQALLARDVPLREVSGREYGQACGVFFDAVQDGALEHRGQDSLNAAVDAGRKRALGDAWAWHRKNAKSDITPLVAATLAHFVAQEQVPETTDSRMFVFS